MFADASGVEVPMLRELHREHRPEVRLYPDAARLIRRLAQTEIPVFLLTDGSGHNERNKTSALGIECSFTAVLVSGETGVDKTQRGAFVRAAAAFPDRTALCHFANNPLQDVIHAQALGWVETQMGDRGENVHPQFGIADVDVIATFDEVDV